MVQANSGQSHTQERKYEIRQFVKFTPGGKTKSDVFRGEHFNIAVICLDHGYEIPSHHEPYDVFFYVVSGKGTFTAGEKQWAAEPGSMVFAPAGVRGIKCIERLIVLAVQEPH